MTITAELHDGRTLEFPDGTDPSIIQATVKKMLGTSVSLPPNKTEDSTLAQSVLKGVSKTWMGGPLGIAMGVGLGADEYYNANLSDLANSIGGKVSEFSTKMGAFPELAGGMGTAANVGVQLVPALATGKIMQTAMAPSFVHGAKNLMRSALKPSPNDARTGEQVVNTMLDEGVNVTRGGVEKLRDKVSTVDSKIADAIANSTATVNKTDVLKTIDDPIKRFANQVDPNSDLSAISSVGQRFAEHPLLPKYTPQHTVPSPILNESGQPFQQIVAASGTNEFPVQQAQALKQGTYNILSKKYGQLGTADTEAQKALARGLKEQIAEKIPGIADLNSQESKLIDALNMTEKRALLNLNQNPIGLSALVHNPALFVAYMADKSAPFKSILARILNSGAQTIPQVGGGLGFAGYQTLFGQKNDRKGLLDF